MSQPSMAGRLEQQHADDGTGRCKSCSAGAQTGHFLHPCSIRLAVDDARRRGEVLEAIVRDVVEHDVPISTVAANWCVRVADIERWVEAAQADAQAPG